MLPVCKAAGTLSAAAIAGFWTTTGRSGAVTAVPLRRSGQLDTTIVKQVPRLIAKNVTETEALSRSRCVRHICTPNCSHYSEPTGSSLRPIAATLRLSLGEIGAFLGPFRCGPASP